MRKTLSKSLVIVFLISMVFYMITSYASISEVRYFGVLKLRELEDGQTVGYQINNKNGKNYIFDMKEFSVPVYEEGLEPLEETPTVYCCDATSGFVDNKIEEYDIGFDMLTEREEAANQNSMLNKLANSGKYNKLLEMFNFMYIPGVSTEEYKQELLQAVNEKYPGEYEYQLTDEDIDAVNQALVWSMTNKDIEKFNNYNEEDWIYYTTDGAEYKKLSEITNDQGTQEGQDRARQAEALYRYLSDKAESLILSGEIVQNDCQITGNSSVEIKELPSESAENVEVLDEGTNVTRVRYDVANIEGHKWDKIEFIKGDDETQYEGYVETEYLKVISWNEPCKINTDELNIRDQAGTGSNSHVLTAVKEGEIVTRLERQSKVISGVVWDKVKTEDGIEGYASSKYLELVPNEIEEEEFKEGTEPITVSDVDVGCESDDSNYIVGPISVTKNNNLLYDIGFTVKASDDTEIENVQILDNEKNQYESEITEGDYYLSIPKVDSETLNIEANLLYESTDVTLWASTQYDTHQILAVPTKVNNNQLTSIEVETGYVADEGNGGEEQKPGLDKPSTPSDSTTDTDKEVSAPTKEKQESTQYKGKLPYTGKKVIGLMLVALITVTYITYKRYKNIQLK